MSDRMTLTSQSILKKGTEYWGCIKTLGLKYWSNGLAWLSANWPGIKQRLGYYAILIRFNKPIGTFLLLWPTLWALWIAAEGHPSLHLFVVFTLGTFLTRSAGCVLNDFADRDYDPHVERTRNRPLAKGLITNKEALLVCASLMFLAFLLVLTTNRLTVLLSFVALILAGIYPFMKRYTYVPQFFLGLAFSWGIPMAFAAQIDSVPKIAWLIYIANILWAMIYDTIYAMVDREDDIRIGVKSTAILFDDADRAIIGIMQGLMLIVLMIIGRELELSWIYFTGLAVAGGLMVYHQYLIKDRVPKLCFQAFLHNNWLGASVFVGILIHYLR